MRSLLSTLTPAVHLVAIHPIDKEQAPVGAWFGAEVDAAETWARAYNAAGWGVYYTANVVREGLHAKPSRANIVSHRVVHVDCDGPDVDEARIAAAAPSWMVHSGGGIQACWLLADDPGREVVEDINRRLIAMLGGDAPCWNSDRLLRLPDTDNYPNAIKRAAGRGVTRARLLLAPTGVRYHSADLLAAWPAAPARAASAGPAEVELGPWEPTRLEDLAPPLPADVLAMCQREAAQGERSEHVSACVVALARAGRSNEEIMGLLMCPDNPGLNAHIADQANPERQARRKVAMAPAHHPARLLAGARSGLPPPSGALSAPKAATAAREVGATYRTAKAYVAVDEQLSEWFRGCVYVVDEDAIHTPTYGMLSTSQFNNRYGGGAFVIDGDGKTERLASVAFLRNGNYEAPSVHTTCFRPTLEPGAVVDLEYGNAVNLWRPVATRQVDGDATPFLDLVARMLPVESDREILLTWMASLVRNPGVKFRWAPVIQGTQGNGKTTLLTVLRHSIGSRYCHFPNTGKLTRNGINFSGWMRHKLLVGMEEIYSAGRRQFLEEIKAYVSNSWTANEAKGIEESMVDDCCNFMFLTNHKDGVPITGADRRYAPLFCAQQVAEDKARDGMTPDYFRRLHAWLDGDGYAICNHYLRTRPLSDALDPAGGALEAPVTSSTAEAIIEGRGEWEAEIADAIETGEPGFRGGWVSAAAALKLLKRQGALCGPKTVRALLMTLGYVPHPALNGLATRYPVNPDGRRTRLYVKPGSIQALNITEAVEVATAYERANVEGLTDLLRR